MIDSTIVRTYQHAAGRVSPKGSGCPGPGAISGGLSTKIHIATDVLAAS